MLRQQLISSEFGRVDRIDRYAVVIALALKPSRYEPAHRFHGAIGAINLDLPLARRLVVLVDEVAGHLPLRAAHRQRIHVQLVGAFVVADDGANNLFVFLTQPYLDRTSTGVHGLRR